MKPFTHFLYGADYNPEQWFPDVWREDMRLMREAGINFVRVGIFAWADLNPAPGVYTFDWLDEVIGLLDEAEIDVCLATATASPPAWLVKLDPEVLPRDYAGQPYHFGSRQMYSAHSVSYRRFAAELVTSLARRYGKHPRVKAWNVNNEYMGHIRDSLTDADCVAFRLWLRDRYGSLEELNRCWGTAFWSQTYHDWEEVDGPRRTLAYRNPALELDWRRFMSESYLELYRAEREIIVRHSPGIPVTTNYMVYDYGTDTHRWSPHLDFLCWDSYPDLCDLPRSHIVNQSMHDLVRASKGGAPWILMEQTPSRTQWRKVNPLKPPGLMRLWSYGAIAHGADGVAFFQWRQSRSGAEKFHGAIAPHGDPALDRTFAEVSALGKELSEISEVLESRMEASIGLIFDYENRWAVENDAKPVSLSNLEALTDWYQPLWENNYTTDVISPEADFTRYRAVFCPLLYLLSEETAARLRGFVECGGVLVVGYFSGIVDPSERAYLGGCPGPLKEVCGVVVSESQVYAKENGNRIRLTSGEEVFADFWADVLHPRGAEILATYRDDFFAGSAAITRHCYGKGRAYYVGTRLSNETLKGLFGQWLGELGIEPVARAPEGIQVTRRRGKTADYYFILNHRAESCDLSLPGIAGIDLLSGESIEERLALKGYGVAVVRVVFAS